MVMMMNVCSVDQSYASLDSLSRVNYSLLSHVHRQLWLNNCCLAFLFVFKQMVMSLRVSELQVLLGYAGRNKHGRKHELLTKALHLLKAGCSPAVQMKIKELYRRRFPQKIITSADLSIPSVHSTSMSSPLSSSTIPQLAFDGHPATSPLLPVSLLGPKHELDLPHLTSALHPVHPDIKLQKLPFYDLLDELIKPTSLGKGTILSLLSMQSLYAWGCK